MKKILVILSVIALLVLTACGNSGKIKCQDGGWVDTAGQCPEVQAAMKQLQDMQNDTDAKLEHMDQDLNNVDLNNDGVGANTDDSTNNITKNQDSTLTKAVSDPVAKTLLDLHNSKNIKAFSFLYASLPENVGTHEYYFYGDKVLITPNLRFKYDAKTNVDHIYLDLSTNTARGFCMSDSLAVCTEQGAERPVKFNDWVIKSPLDWFNQPGLENAKKTGSKNFENFEVDILRFQYEGQYYEYLISTFWGLPVRVGIYSDPDYTQLVGGAEYRNFAVNGFKQDKVLPPN